MLKVLSNAAELNDQEELVLRRQRLDANGGRIVAIVRGAGTPGSRRVERGSRMRLRSLEAGRDTDTLFVESLVDFHIGGVVAGVIRRLE